MIGAAKGGLTSRMPFTGRSLPVAEMEVSIRAMAPNPTPKQVRPIRLQAMARLQPRVLRGRWVRRWFRRPWG